MMHVWKKLLITFLACIALMVSACKQDLGQIARDIEAMGQRVTNAQNTANAAQRDATQAQNAATAAQRTADQTAAALNDPDGGVNARLGETFDRIAALEACNPGDVNYRESDCDGDGIANRIDACPNESQGQEARMQVAVYARRGCPDTDQDSDNVGDSQDTCIAQAQGPHGDIARPGCPDVDSDNDGFFDSEDECHLTPVRSDTTPTAPENDTTHNGCPANASPDVDSDQDGIRDYRDACPNQKVGDDPHPTQLGCPDVDSDNDGHPDRWDGCPHLPVQRVDTEEHRTADERAGIPLGNIDYPGCPQHMTPNDSAPSTAVTVDGGTGEPPAAPPTPAAADAPVAPTPSALPEGMIAGREVVTSPPLAGNRQAEEDFCHISRSALAAIRLMGESACTGHAPYCIRLRHPSEELERCSLTDTPAPGCVLGNGSVNICTAGAEEHIAVRCGPFVTDCTAANVAAAVAQNRTARRMRADSSTHGRRGSITMNVSYGVVGMSLSYP